MLGYGVENKIIFPGTSNKGYDCLFFVFIWFSGSWNSSFQIKKGGNYKIIFPTPLP